MIVAVVGVQYNYSSFYSTFFKIAEHYKLDCHLDEINCFVLDNNGFVIISNHYQHAGLFIGQINGDLLQDMIARNIYKKTKFFDYQAICIRITPFWNGVQSLMTPFKFIKQTLLWITARLLNYFTIFNEYSFALSEMSIEEPDYESMCLMNKKNNSI